MSRFESAKSINDYIQITFDIMKSKKIAILVILVCIPGILSLAVPLYNSGTEFYGIPFFYWFQIILLAFSTAFYLAYSFVIDGNPKVK